MRGRRWRRRMRKETEVELGHKGKGKEEMRREDIFADLVGIVSKVICTVFRELQGQITHHH